MFSSEDHEKFHGRARSALLDIWFLSTLKNAAFLAVLLLCVIGAIFLFRTVRMSASEDYDPAPMTLVGP